jgi:hypothetical protein
MRWLMIGVGSVLAGVAGAAGAAAAQSFDVTTRSITAPAAICDVDVTALKGEIRRLSWSPNGQSMHLQTVDPRNGDLYDYIVDLGNNEISLAFGEPAWAAEYWMRKSSLVAPGRPELKLDVTEKNRRTRPVPFTGGFGNGGAQTPDPRNPVDAYEHEVTLRFAGEEIGNWINGAPMAGDTFGWGPDGSGALAFTDKSGRLTLIDQARRKLAVTGVKDAVFPAWSADGARLAWLQKTGRKKYKLVSAALTAPP